MSELIQKNDNRTTIHWKLLTGASALALAVCSTSPVKAEDADHSLLWIELGGQMEQASGLSAPFVAPFMTITPTPDIYKGFAFAGSQRPARYSFGEEAKITLQPRDSDWLFSAGIRYGRSHANRHTHHQKSRPSQQWVLYYYGYPYATYTATFAGDALADTQTRSSESHLILDFMAGKDVGLGLFGREGTSTISGGVRIASFAERNAAHISGRPTINTQIVHYNKYYGLLRFDVPHSTFNQYTMIAQANRSFRGIGPALSWNSSAVIAGNAEHGELALDLGINASLLFGKQKARTQHSTQAYHNTTFHGSYPELYHHSPPASVRSRSVTVPNIGGYAALTAQFKGAKVSFGYRYDAFLKAMDTGIDARKTSNLTFNGPYASISIGIGD